MLRANRWTALALIALAELLALSVWFSASAVAPQLAREWGLTPLQVAFLTSSVQIGFMTGAFGAAVSSLADRWPARVIFAASSLAAGIFTALIMTTPPFGIVITLRFLTGMALAGVYPIAVKLLAEWFPVRRGVAIGVLIGALTMGSALPHLLVSESEMAWRLVLATGAALAAAAAGVVMWLLPDAPRARCAHATPFSWHALRHVVRNRSVMLANFGYFGHMWELYAMWTWFPAFVAASAAAYGVSDARELASLEGFVVVGIAGCIGCVLAGFLADRWGRTTITSIAMIISGACCLLIGFTFAAAPLATLLVGLVWGGAVVADSAQFSAAVTELSDPEELGTALTFQMSIGFLLTFISINLMPLVVGSIGWPRAFWFLAVGPALGTAAMLALRRSPAAAKLANGVG